MGRERSVDEALRAQREAPRRIGAPLNWIPRRELGSVTAHGANRERVPTRHGLTDAPLTRAALLELEQRLDALERRLEELEATLRCDRS